MLVGVRITAFPLVLMTRLNKNESAVFKYCRFSIFLKESKLFSFLQVNTVGGNEVRYVHAQFQ